MGLSVYVLYQSPRDYPGEWVVRRQFTERQPSGEVLVRADPHLSGRGESREACEEDFFSRVRAAERMVWLPRREDDEPQIVGTWL